MTNEDPGFRYESHWGNAPGDEKQLDVVAAIRRVLGEREAELTKARAEIARLRALLREAMEGIRPLAECGEWSDDFMDGSDIEVELKLGDVRGARAILETIETTLSNASPRSGGES
ncbi:MAG: hypothetical protein N2444_00190 [Methylocystis sp.]|nr:hypothetical protein [Methylocystis sp.]